MKKTIQRYNSEEIKRIQWQTTRNHGRRRLTGLLRDTRSCLPQLWPRILSSRSYVPHSLSSSPSPSPSSALILTIFGVFTRWDILDEPMLIYVFLLTPELFQNRRLLRRRCHLRLNRNALSRHQERRISPNIPLSLSPTPFLSTHLCSQITHPPGQINRLRHRLGRPHPHRRHTRPLQT